MGSTGARTRQGCPLSLILFVLAFEPLALRISRDATCYGIPIGASMHLVSAYADDLIIYLVNMLEGQGPLPRIFVEFATVSGLSINDSKSHAFFFEEQMYPSLHWLRRAPATGGLAHFQISTD